MPTRRLVRIAVVKTAFIAAALYFLLGLLLAPIFILGLLMEGNFSGLAALIGFIALPVAYGVFGFIFTAATCAIFNLIAPRLGGVEVVVE